MRYELYPVIDIYDLEDGLKAQYGKEFFDSLCPDHFGNGNLRGFLFGDHYMNDIYCSFYYGSLDEYTGASWQDEDDINKRNCVKAYLQDTLPNWEMCLISVAW